MRNKNTVESNKAQNGNVPYVANNSVNPASGQAPTPLFADVARPVPPAPAPQPTPPVAATPVFAGPVAPLTGTAPLPPAPPPPAPTGLPPAGVSTSTPPTPKKPRNWRKLLVRSGVVTLVLLLIGSGILLFDAFRNQSQNTPVNNAIANTTIPLSEFANSGSLSLLGAQSLTVNGQLRANESFVLTPNNQPTASEKGQLYYDKNSNVLAYYNGSQFVQLNGNSGVQTFQGQTGNVTLVGGNGVTITGTTISNGGVTSFGDQTGAITLGSGLAMNGATLQSTGITSAVSGSNNVIVNTDANGQLTISTTPGGTGTVQSPGGTAGTIAMFTGDQTIDSSIITQSGLTVTITGDLSVVTGGLTLSNALTISNGGTGTNSLAANGVIVGNGTSALSSVTAASAGLCLLSTAGQPTFGACPSGSGVTSVNGLTGALSIANASGSGTTITLDDASTSAKGIASFNSTNFSASTGIVNTIQDINTTAAPTFGSLTLSSSQATNPMLLVNNTNASATGNLLDAQLNGSSKFSVAPSGNVIASGTINGQTITSAANFTGTLGVASTLTAGGAIQANGGSITSTGALTIAPSGTLTLGSSSQTLALQGGTSSSFVVTSGANSTTLNFQAPTATVTYRVPTAAAGTYDLCTTAGNCSGVGGGVTTSGGTTNKLAKFTSGQGIGDSSISDDGTTVTTTANLVVQGGAMTIGVANSQSGTLTLAYGSANFNGVITQGAITADRTYTLPDSDGTVCLSSGNCLGGGSGGANTSLSNLTGVAINTSLLPGSTSIDLGSGSAPFRDLYLAGSSLTPSSNHFIITGTATGARTITLPDASGTVCLQNSSSCGFATGSGVAILQGGNTLGTAADIGTNDNFALNLRTNGATQVTVGTNGNTTFNADIAVNGGDITSNAALNITPGGTLTVGATGQALVMQGNASTQLTASSGGFTTTIGFTGTPTASVTYNFDRTAATGSYTICTTAANCSGVGGGVTTSSAGTTGTLPVFTASQTIADSLVSQSGSVVTANGDINLTTGHVYKINGTQIGSGNLSNDSDLAKLSSSQTFTGNTNSFKNGTNSTNGFNVQNASGTRVLTVDTAGGQLVLGTSNALGGALVFNDVASAFTSTISTTTLSADRTLTIPDASGVICTDSGNCNGAGATLQTAYNFSVGGTTPKIKLNSTLLGVDIQDADTTIAANLFNVRASNSSGLGSVMFGVGNTGQVTLQNSSNSSTALRVLTSGGTSVLTADTQNGQILLGQSGTLSGALVFRNSTNTNAITLTTDAVTGSQTITLPDASGIVCLDSGNCSGAGSSNTLQAAYDAGNSINTSSGRDVAITLADSTTDGNLTVTTATGATGFTTFSRANGSGTADPAQLILISNADTDRSLPIGLNFSGTIGTDINRTSGTLTIQGGGGITIGNGSTAIAVQGSSSSTFSGKSGSFTSTLGFTTPTANHTINLPDEGGTICLQSSTSCGFVTGSGTAFVQGGNAFGAVANFGTTDNYGINFITNNTNAGSITNAGEVQFKNPANSTVAFDIQNASGSTLFKVDTTDSRVGINLGGSNTPNSTLEVNGTLRISGSDVENFDTPQGNHIPTKINIPLMDPGNFGQLIALGLPSTAQSTSRAISLMDARTSAHQPTLAVFSPDENNAIGFNWNGSNEQANVQTLDHTTGSTSAISLQSGIVSAGAGSSGTVYVESGSIAGSTGYQSGAIIIQSGTAGGTSAVSGNVSLDVGTATGTLGQIYIGANNTGNINIGHTSGSTNTTNIIRGVTTFEPNTDSSTSLVVQDAAGTQMFAVGGVGGVQQTQLGFNGTFTGRLQFNGGGASNTHTVTLIGQASPTSDRSITLPDASGTVCLDSGNCSSAGAYILNQSGSDQTGSLRISGTARANTGLQAPLLDTSAAGALGVGTTNATSINIGNSSNTATTVKGTAFQVQNSSSISLLSTNTSTNTINVGATGADALATTVNIATSSGGIQTVNVGSTNSSSTTTIQGGSGNINLKTTGNIVIGTSDTTGTLLVLDTKTGWTAGQTSDPTGVVGGMYYNSGSGTFRCYQVDHWSDCLVGARSGYHRTFELGYQGGQEDDFTAYSDGAISQPAGETGHPGITQLNTINAGGYGYAGSQADNAILLGNNDYWRYETVIRLPSLFSALSSSSQRYIVRVGFHQQKDSFSGGESANGCFFRYSDNINSGKWQGYCADASVSSTCDTGTAVAMDTWYRMAVVVNAAGNQADFRINGVSKCTVTTHIPTASGHVTGFGNSIQKTIGSSDADLDNDYEEIEGQFGTPR